MNANINNSNKSMKNDSCFVYDEKGGYVCITVIKKDYRANYTVKYFTNCPNLYLKSNVISN